jgi:hypothetical protein
MHVFGTIAALILAVLYMTGQTSTRPVTLGFLSMMAGALWTLVDWDSQLKQLGLDTIGALGSGIGLSQGIGLRLMLGAGVARAVVCILYWNEPAG